MSTCFNPWFHRVLAVGPVLLAACTPSDDDPIDSDGSGDSDAVCAFERPDRAAPGTLQAGVATARIPAPVGIGTAGFGPTGAPSSESPYSAIYPGTKRIHGHPEIKVVALSRGEGHEVVFVRLDAVGMFSQLRNDIVERASERVGRDLDDVLVLGATHTHSGPGRVINTGSDDVSFFDIIADQFDPYFYDAFVDQIVDTVAEAFDDLAPAELGSTVATCDDAHNDRRCADGERYQNGALPMVLVRRAGQIDAMVFSYAIHGTLMGLSDLHLSQDVSGGIEEALEDRFDHPVEALFFNSWGADMSPASPTGIDLDADAADLGDDYLRMRTIGETVARSVDAVIEDAAWTDEPPIHLETHRYRIDREVIGYDDQTFEQYEFGGVYCGLAGDVECVEGTPSPPIEGLDDGCVPFPEPFPAPNQSSTTVGTVGPYTIVTFPGEPGTRLAEGLISRLKAAHPDVGEVMFLGYTQDYLGYSIEEEDWWRGEYEAGGAMWGPRQGEYLRDTILSKYDSFATGSCPEEPAKLDPFPYTLDGPRAVATPIDVGLVIAEPQADVGASDVVTFTIAGKDPWLGAPRVRLLDGDGDPVLRPNGMPVTADDYNADVELTVDPPWEEAASSRTFSWRYRVPVTQPVGGVSLPDGTYRFEATIPEEDAPITSAPFTVTRAVDSDTDG